VSARIRSRTTRRLIQVAPKLLGAIVDVLDVGTTFPRLSGTMLPEGHGQSPD
jgi:hypothetical protein